MIPQHYNILIDAPRERVWEVLWDDASYRVWTSAFSEGSRAVTDWKKGSKVLFLNADDDGMVSTIAENIPNEFMSIKHLGVVFKGVEDLDNEEYKSWAGVLENYRLKTIEGKTELMVDFETTDDQEDYFKTTWPKALQKVKELAEKAKEVSD